MGWDLGVLVISARHVLMDLFYLPGRSIVAFCNITVIKFARCPADKAHRPHENLRSKKGKTREIDRVEGEVGNFRDVARP